MKFELRPSRKKKSHHPRIKVTQSYTEKTQSYTERKPNETFLTSANSMNFMNFEAKPSCKK
jgi:hypothetical protein